VIKFFPCFYALDSDCPALGDTLALPMNSMFCRLVAGTCEPIDECFVSSLVKFAAYCGGSLSMQGNHRIGLDELIK
jgi:hypothetical protein